MKKLKKLKLKVKWVKKLKKLKAVLAPCSALHLPAEHSAAGPGARPGARRRCGPHRDRGGSGGLRVAGAGGAATGAT